jgi:MFS family permease
VKGHVSESLRSLVDVFRNRDLRRLQLAWIGSIIGNWAYLVALVVYAYDQGGPAAVGIVGVLRMLPAAFAAPIVATLADRYPRKLVLIGSDLIRAALMVLAGLTIYLDGPAPVVYLIVTLATVVGTVFRPAQAALLPSLARTPSELTAANVASSTFESVGSFAGPALGGLLLAATNAETVFLFNGLTFVWSAALVAAIRSSDSRSREQARRRGGLLGAEMSAGLREIFGNRDLRTLCGLYTGQTFVAGALSVLVVVSSLELLEMGDAGVGYLNAALGVGGLIGGFVALIAAAGGRLAVVFGVGVCLYSVPLVVVGLAPSVLSALIALSIIGLGNSLVDVNALTIMQRIVPDEVLGRALGGLQGMLLGSIGIGALVAPALIHVAGIDGALVVTGLLLPVLVLLTAGRLRAIDARAAAPAGLELLRRVEFLAPLPEQSLEHLARSLIEVVQPAGAVLIREGEPGDRFYVIGVGEVEIGGKTFGPGEGFGEIALLQDVPRTATVTVVTDVTLYALERDDFIAAVTGHEPANAAAEAVIAARLGAFNASVSPT